VCIYGYNVLLEIFEVTTNTEFYLKQLSCLSN